MWNFFGKCDFNPTLFPFASCKTITNWVPKTTKNFFEIEANDIRVGELNYRLSIVSTSFSDALQENWLFNYYYTIVMHICRSTKRNPSILCLKPIMVLGLSTNKPNLTNSQRKVPKTTKAYDNALWKLLRFDKRTTNIMGMCLMFSKQHHKSFTLWSTLNNKCVLLYVVCVVLCSPCLIKPNQ